ncbi:MAG TPA: hypothetical protein VF742_10645, partial [Terracidiphilus sp.]
LYRGGQKVGREFGQLQKRGERGALIRCALGYDRFGLRRQGGKLLPKRLSERSKLGAEFAHRWHRGKR